MVEAVVSAMVGALVGVIAFVVIKSLVSAQDQTDWSAAEIAIMEVIPIAIGILVLIGVFKALR